MVRFVLGFAAVIGLCLASARADDQKKTDKGNQNQATGKDQPTHKGEKEAKVTNMDAKKGTVTVEMTDKNGKKMDKTFHLTGEVRYFDSTGRVAAADLFRAGDYVLVVEEEGHLKQIQKKDKSGSGQAKSGSSNSGNKPPSKP